MTSRMLGRKPARRDARTLKLSNYLRADVLPAPKPQWAWSSFVSGWGMMANDQFGDCTCAGWGHLKLLRTTLAKSPVVMSDTDVLALYSAVTAGEGAAFTAGPPAQNDNGCVLLDVLNHLRQAGAIGAYAAIDVHNLDHLRFAVEAFEGAYVGLELPMSAQGENDSGKIWSATTDEPGSWGGHCVILTDHSASPQTLTSVTWGALQTMTWEWWEKYGDEAYAILSPDLVSGTAPAPSGFDVAQLTADLADVTA